MLLPKKPKPPMPFCPKSSPYIAKKDSRFPFSLGISTLRDSYWLSSPSLISYSTEKGHGHIYGKLQKYVHGHLLNRWDVRCVSGFCHRNREMRCSKLTVPSYWTVNFDSKIFVRCKPFPVGRHERYHPWSWRFKLQNNRVNVTFYFDILSLL